MTNEELKPVRVPRKRMKGWRMPENAVYVGRGSTWGNDYKIGSIGFGKLGIIKSTKGAIRSYKAELMAKLFFRPNLLNEIKGKNLACWCPLDRPCHADVLLELANK